MTGGKAVVKIFLLSILLLYDYNFRNDLQIIAGKGCEGVKSEGKCEEKNINDLERNQSQ